MATARSFSAQDAAQQSATASSSRPPDRMPPAPAAAHAWNVLAKLPAVSIEESQEPAGRTSTASTKPSYRFDPPEALRPHAAIESTKSASPMAGSTARTATKASHALPDATGLPLWARPAHVSADVWPSAEPDGGVPADGFAASLIRFLLLVALFTAAGLSLRLMFTTSPAPTTAPMETPVRATEHSASTLPARAPVAPPEPSSPEPSSKVLAERATPAPIAAEPSPPITIISSTIAVEEVPVDRPTDQDSAKVVYPKTLQPMLTVTDQLKPDQDATQAPELSPAIARLPGYILEVPPRQAQHDHDEPYLH